MTRSFETNGHVWTAAHEVWIFCADESHASPVSPVVRGTWLDASQALDVNGVYVISAWGREGGPGSWWRPIPEVPVGQRLIRLKKPDVQRVSVEPEPGLPALDQVARKLAAEKRMRYRSLECRRCREPLPRRWENFAADLDALTADGVVAVSLQMLARRAQR